MTRHYYGFRFADGVNTTTGGDHGTKLRIAGQLWRFNSKEERDDWVNMGYDVRVPRDWGEFRLATSTRRLPFGWHIRDALDYDDYSI